MATEIRVPDLGESIVEATVGEWHKQPGDVVAIGEPVVSLETDKVDVEVGAEVAGVMADISHQSGEDVQVGQVLGFIEANGAAAPSSETPPQTKTATPDEKRETEVQVTPVARRLAAEKGVDLAQVAGGRTDGKITRQDVEAHLEARPKAEPATPQTNAAPPRSPGTPAPDTAGMEERQRMTRRRRTIAQRLVEAQQTAAMLTTFNEIDMSAVMELRKRRQPAFVERHGVKLGFTSFFVKAAIGALKAFPLLNAEIDGDEIVLKHYYDMGIAVGDKEGLVVPVIRGADKKSFAEIEREVKSLAQKAGEGNLSLDDLRGGTFTITNGGVFGSMLSTPILNPPQVGILGLHNIKERPVVLDSEIVSRPIMYVALTYDHRIVDGREAVQFLVRIKELVEDPEALLLEG